MTLEQIKKALEMAKTICKNADEEWVTSKKAKEYMDAAYTNLSLVFLECLEKEQEI